MVLLLALVGGTSAAFVITQSLKDERSPVGVPRFDRVLAPTCDCPTSTAKLRLRLRKADRVTARIVDEDGKTVVTLADGKRVRRGPLTLTWNGRTADGAIAPDGRYRLEVRLARADRTILLPTTIRVDTVAPTLELVRVEPQELVSGKGRFRVVYRSNDQAAAVLAVSGEDLPETVVVRGRFRPKGRAKLNWPGRVDGRPLPPGEYTLVLRLRDRAGNESEPATATVEIVPGASG
jgi:flagellar hook assembly protein FlgD